MSTAKKRITSKDLIEILDLNERKEFAEKLNLVQSQEIKDEKFLKSDTFLESLCQFSVTTCLTTIMEVRRPIIQMLCEIFQFMEGKAANMKTTTHTIVLPNLPGELELVFNPALKEAIAKALNSKKFLSSLETLNKTAKEIRLLIKDIINYISPYIKHRETNLSRKYRQNVKTHLYANLFKKKVKVYNANDFDKVKEISKRIREINDKIKKLTEETNKIEGFPTEKSQSINKEIKGAVDIINNKYKEMENSIDERNGSKYINENKYKKLLEKMDILKEEIYASSDFQTAEASIRDFLDLDLWHKRERIYELWSLVYLLNLFQSLGFTIDLSERVSNHVWNLKYGKDKDPVANLFRDNIILEVYYQLYKQEADGGNMPDIAIKKKDDARYMIVTDPKYGISYTFKELKETLERYASAFPSDLVVIHNFYNMSHTGYDYEPHEKNPHWLIVSNVYPGSENIQKLRNEIISIIPYDYKQKMQSIIILVDVSGSMRPYRNQLAQLIDEIVTNYIQASQDSSLLFFNDKIIKEISINDVSISNIKNINDLLDSLYGGGTQITFALETAIQKLETMPQPRLLYLFTDGKDDFGQDDFDIASMAQNILLTKLDLFSINEIGKSDEKESPLKKLAQGCEGKGKYQQHNN